MTRFRRISGAAPFGPALAIIHTLWATTAQAQAATPAPTQTSAPPTPPTPPPPTAAQATDEPTPKTESWTDHVKIGGGGVLRYYQPFLDGAKNNVEFFHIRLTADVTAGAFGFHIEPRFRDSKLRPYYDSAVWIEEGYASWKPIPELTVKLGKQYSRLGLFWDNSFYGNVQVYDGLKLSADHGVSVEGVIGDRAGLSYWAQFFLIDGKTNVSLPSRDTFSIEGARRRNELVLHVEPFFKFADDGVLRVGASLQTLTADLPTGKKSVVRFAGHAKLTVGGLGLWGEFLHQSGRHTTDFPYAGSAATSDKPATAGRSSRHNNYFEAGAEYTFDRFTARYNVSFGSYDDLDVSEWLHVPALAVKLADPLTLQAELAFWKRKAPEGSTDVDKSLNVLLFAKF
jgi:hypothetical protein